MTDRPKLILASGSARRLALLQQVGIEPDHIRPADIDETPQKREMPRALAKRLSLTKAEVAMREARIDSVFDDSFLISADTVVAVGRRILPKAETMEEAEHCMRLLSGRQHRVYTGLAVATPKGKVRQKIVETRVRFKRLTGRDLDAYLAAGEWRGKAGGYAIQGIAGSFVLKLVGSYTNVVGLPLRETMALLEGNGFPVHDGWDSIV
ncbi:Maf-like protein [Coralliovum pocilloporae]|uniref:Maf-like protein n=1 Tax=Coralliovum pocilloporae TaxID=3066369 RepID=UPI0033074579